MTFGEKQKRNNLFRQELIKRATKEELIVKDFLEVMGIPFIFQKGLLLPFHRIVDFYIPGSRSKRLILEIDGGYHEQILAKDTNKDQSAASVRNMRTLRIKNEQVHSGEFRNMILAALGRL